MVWVLRTGNRRSPGSVGDGMKLAAGDVISARTLTTAFDNEIRIPDEERVVHLQFRRYAGCPICNSHMRSVAARISDIEEAGVREVVVFHSPVDELRAYADELPFDTVADPQRELYREFGVETSLAGLFRPAVAVAAMRGFRKGALSDQVAVGQNHFGLPADFLIDSDGRVLAVHYGKHASDQWSVDELLELVLAHQRT
jgi:peroxiredoxin